MEEFFVIVLLMVSVLVANLLSKWLTWIPLAFLQIGVGMLLSLAPQFAHFQMQPELFLLVIIAPLLFNDSQNTKLRELAKYFETTFAVAVVLAIITIIMIGAVLNWQFSYFTLPLAIALSAIVTPTDAVAVKSVTATRKVPTQVMQTLEFESLFNDASGIVIFDLALTVLATNRFSFGESVWNFIYVFIGGLIVGLIVGGLILRLRFTLLAKDLGEANLLVPISILTPFAVYLIAEHVGVSGILAVVAAGMMHAYEQTRLRLTSTRLQVVNKEVWQIVSDLLNGFVFIILGLLLSRVVTSMADTSLALIPVCLLIAALIYSMMLLVRFLFVRFNLAGQNWHGRDSWVFSFGGVHGTMTLAMAFSLPLMLNGNPFPFRTEAIFIAAVVIMLSLLAPAIIFPMVLPVKASSFTADEFKTARLEMINYALYHLNGLEIDGNIQTVVRDNLRSQDGFFTGNKKVLFQLIEGANTANVEAIEAAVATGELPPIASELTKHLLLKYQRGHFWQMFKWRLKRLLALKHQFNNEADRDTFIQKVEALKLTHQDLVEDIKKVLKQATNDYLQTVTTATNQAEIKMVSNIYLHRWGHFESVALTDEQQTQLNDAYVQAFQLEHQFIQDRLNAGKITQGLAKKLAEIISSSELVQFEAGLLSEEG